MKTKIGFWLTKFFIDSDLKMKEKIKEDSEKRKKEWQDIWSAKPKKIKLKKDELL